MTDETRVDRTDEPTAPQPPERLTAAADPTRLRAVRTVAAADEPPTFTELFEASEADTTAGFAYHLRQLTGRYLRKRDERYHLTYAGRRLARAVDAGTFTDSADRQPEEIDGDCPICDEAGLVAAVADNIVAIACGTCETELLALPFTPNGIADRSTEETLAAFDSYHRARLSMVADGVCPDCGGRATARLDCHDHPAVPTDERRPVADCACEDCGFGIRVPVSLLLTDHPAVRAFAADHGIALDERPIWNLGSEWAERVVNEEPTAVAVSVTAETERVELLVGDGPTVARTRRESVEAADAAARESLTAGESGAEPSSAGTDTSDSTAGGRTDTSESTAEGGTDTSDSSTERTDTPGVDQEADPPAGSSAASTADGSS